jgi:hypothetical protein
MDHYHLFGYCSITPIQMFTVILQRFTVDAVLDDMQRVLEKKFEGHRGQ